MTLRKINYLDAGGAIERGKAMAAERNVFDTAQSPSASGEPASPGYNNFGQALGNSESGGDYGVMNAEGYGGKYQFGQDRLDDYNNTHGTRYTVEEILSNPGLQEEVFKWHIQDIDTFINSNGLNSYLGQNVNGVPVTMDGLRAAAHLGGKGGMRKMLESGGGYNPADSNGTSLTNYLAKFG